MITSKQRAALRKCANSIDPIFNIGKGGINDELIKGMGDALKKRELIKAHVLENCEYSAREACDILAEGLDAEPVQTIGYKFALYKMNDETDQYGEIFGR